MNKEKREFLKHLVGSALALFMMFVTFPPINNQHRRLEGKEVVLEVEDGGVVVKQRNES